MHGLVNLSRAAELLTEAGDSVSRSSLSRYVKKYADALLPTEDGGKTFVNFEDLAKHRRQNIRLDLGAEAPTQRPSINSNRADEAALNTRAQRLMREIELGKELKLLVPRAEVEEAARASVMAMRNALSMALNDTAEAIAATAGVDGRLIRPHLRAFERKALETFRRDLTARQMLVEGGAPE
ncbi:hypothetical protein FB480_103445 [Agrobacterium vitis]|nr:hypothetical protein FB480_103445 [Agrobacterium vitis]